MIVSPTCAVCSSFIPRKTCYIDEVLGDDDQDDDQQGEMPDELPETGVGGMSGVAGLPVDSITGALSLLAVSGYAILRRR